ncbi:hypothetical protein [Bosea sp. (in: a-proteobacteria)]
MINGYSPVSARSDTPEAPAFRQADAKKVAPAFRDDPAPAS